MSFNSNNTNRNNNKRKSSSNTSELKVIIDPTEANNHANIFQVKKQKMDSTINTDNKVTVYQEKNMRNVTLNLSNKNGTTSKKIIIKNLRGLLINFFLFCFTLKFLIEIIFFFSETPKSSEDSFTRLWPLLKQAVEAIHKSKPISISLEILYQHVENLCSEKKSQQLFTSLKTLCEEHIKDGLPNLTKPIDDQYEYLKLLNQQWQNHCSHMMMICQIFLPLDRGYVLNNPSILSIW
jgi:hypothetical protein